MILREFSDELYAVSIPKIFPRIQQLEEENSEMKVNVCRLKSQTEKLDQVSDIITRIIVTANLDITHQHSLIWITF